MFGNLKKLGSKLTESAKKSYHKAGEQTRQADRAHEKAKSVMQEKHKIRAEMPEALENKRKREKEQADAAYEKARQNMIKKTAHRDAVIKMLQQEKSHKK